MEELSTEPEIPTALDTSEPGGSEELQQSGGNLLNSLVGSTDSQEENPYYRLIYSNTNDIVAGRYHLRFDLPLEEFSSAFAKAYVAEDKRQEEDCYAIVFDKKFPPRLPIINTLKGNNYAFFSTPVAVEVVQCTALNGQYLVVVMLKPNGIKLVNYLTENGPLNEVMVIDQIIVPLVNLIKIFSDLNITHGNINVNNIYIGDNQRITLGECISEPPGFSQMMLYEPLERAVTIPIAKGEGDKSVDYYALGVLVLHIVIGEKPCFGQDEDTILHNRIAVGTYSAYTAGEVKVPPRLTDLLKGLLSDKKMERWKHRQIADWLKGRRYNLMNPISRMEASRYIEFHDKRYYNIRGLVFDLHKTWDNARRFLMEDKLIKWIERSIMAPEIAERLRAVRKLASSARTYIDDDEFIARTLIILDPEGPLRLKEFVASVDGVSMALAYAYAKGKREYFYYISRVITSRLGGVWAENKTLSSNSPVWALDRLHPFVNEKSIGFGMERCLYEMNPTLPCLGTFIGGDYVTTIATALRSMDKFLTSAKPRESVDRHTMAFIAQRIDLQAPIRIRISSRYKEIESNQELQSLALLANAQKHGRVRKLNHICDYLVTRMMPVIGYYNGKSIRQEIENRIKELAKSGDLIAMYKVMTDVNFARRDFYGFTAAAKRYAELDKKIAQYRNRKVISEIGYRYGLQLALTLSYLICAVVLAILFMKIV